MNETDPIQPLKDVWLRPRRVFRELAKRPIGPWDYALAAAQGIAEPLMIAQLQSPHARPDGWNIIAVGPIVGLLSTMLFAFIYNRMGLLFGGSGQRSEVFHILAYSGVPLVAYLLGWIVTFAVLGEAPFLNRPGEEVESFVWIVSRLQFAVSVLLFFWSILLQVMGFSEIFKLSVLKSFALWLLGQVAGVLLNLWLAALFPQLFAAPN